MPYAILAAVLVIADQVVKFLIRSNLELGESVPFIPHILNLTYYQNTGAAFSLFREHTWILALISAVVSVALVVVMVKRVFRHPAGQVRRRGQPHRPGALRLCDRYVPDHFHQLRRVQRGRLLPGVRRHRHDGVRALLLRQAGEGHGGTGGRP